MRRWVLTYPYPHPRPSDDLLGRVLPQPRHPFRRQTASLQALASPFSPKLCPLPSLGGSTPTLVRNVLSRPPSQKLIQGRHFNRRSHHSFHHLRSFSLFVQVDQVEGERERNRKWWKELRPVDDTRRRRERDASSRILWKTCYTCITVHKIISIVPFLLRGEMLIFIIDSICFLVYFLLLIIIVAGYEQCNTIARAYVSIIIITTTSNLSLIW